MNLLVPLFIGIILCANGNGPGNNCNAKRSKIDDSLSESKENDPYEYHLIEVNHAVAGRISINTARGERVLAVKEELLGEGEGHGEAEAGPKYLKLSYYINPLNMASTANFDIVMTTEKRPVPTSQPPKAQAQTSEKQTPEPVTSQKDTVTSHMASPAADEPSSDSSEVATDDQSAPAVAQAAPLVGSHHAHAHHSIHLTHHTLGGHAVNIHKRDVHAAVGHGVTGHAATGHAAGNHVDHVWYNVAETSAFYVDHEDNYIKVGDMEELHNHVSIEFYVYLTNDLGAVISNPLPFTVHIDRPVEEKHYPLAPAVFAGVLVLVIVFLALFIPFVTRAKRRYRQGKPVFKLGSHPSDLDKASMSRASSEPNWYGNNAYYNYEDEVARDRQDFSSGIKRFTNVPSNAQLTKTNKETLSVNSGSGSSGIDLASQFAEGTVADENMSQRL